MTFARNMGTWDRIARFLLGALLIGLALAGTIGPWGYVGLVPLATAFLNFCPLYRIVGLKTCSDC